VQRLRVPALGAVAKVSSVVLVVVVVVLRRRSSNTRRRWRLGEKETRRLLGGRQGGLDWVSCDLAWCKEVVDCGDENVGGGGAMMLVAVAVVSCLPLVDGCAESGPGLSTMVGGGGGPASSGAWVTGVPGTSSR